MLKPRKYTKTKPTREECVTSMAAIQDTLYVLGGKWKLLIIIALMDGEGPRRFKELQRAVKGITPKILSKELKDLELNEFVIRTVYDTAPVSVEYELTDYSMTLDKVLQAMREWGLQHRKRLMACSKARRARQSEAAH